MQEKRMTEVSRKWSATGTGLDAAESEARRLEKKGTFAATMDEEAGTVTLSKEDFKSVMGKLGTHKRTAKTAKKNVLLLAFGYLAVTIGFIAVIVGLVNWRLEATKESHVVDSALVGRDGQSVETASIETFAQLFDIPHFSIETLEKINRVSVTLADNRQVSFGVTRIIKSAGSTRVQLEDANGNGLDIDSCSTLALARINGELTTIKGLGAQKNRNLASSAAPRLYSATEFQALKAEQRVLGEGSAAIGHAAIGARAIDAILDTTEAEYPERTMTYIAGETLIVGEEGSVESYNMEVVTAVGTDGQQHYRLNYEAPNMKMKVDTGNSMSFEYTVEGDLKKCEILGEDAAANIQNGVGNVFDVKDCNADGYVVTMGTEEGETAYFRTSKIDFHANLEMISIPTAYECGVAYVHSDEYEFQNFTVPEEYASQIADIECSDDQEECDEPSEFRLAKEAGRDVTEDRALYAQEMHGELTTDTFGFTEEGRELAVMRRGPGSEGGGGYGGYGPGYMDHGQRGWSKAPGYYRYNYNGGNPRSYRSDDRSSATGWHIGTDAKLANINSNRRAAARGFENGAQPDARKGAGFRYPSELLLVANFAYYEPFYDLVEPGKLYTHVVRVNQSKALYWASRWISWRLCQGGLSSTGWFYYKYPTVAFSFTGSDGSKIYDFGLAVLCKSFIGGAGRIENEMFQEYANYGLGMIDYAVGGYWGAVGVSYSRTKINGEASLNGKAHALGAVMYVGFIAPCIMQGRGRLAAFSPSIGVDYWVGHSLGAASSVVMEATVPSTFGTVSFAAYPSAYGRRCSQKGIRIIHADDPIGGAANVIPFGSESHDVRTVYRYNKNCKTVGGIRINAMCAPQWENHTGNCNVKTGRKIAWIFAFILDAYKAYNKFKSLFTIKLKNPLRLSKESFLGKLIGIDKSLGDKWFFKWTAAELPKNKLKGWHKNCLYAFHYIGMVVLDGYGFMVTHACATSYGVRVRALGFGVDSAGKQHRRDNRASKYPIGIIGHQNYAL